MHISSNNKFQNAWESIRSSLWLIPSLMVFSAIAFGILTLQLDYRFGDEITDRIPWLYTGSPEGARLILSTIASSMISVAGLVFSITMVTFTLASSQFGHRLLRNFIDIKGNQLVLGAFIATFTYCIILLRSVRGLEDATFVPQLSISIAILLSIISLGLFIYFIQSVSSSVQVDKLVARISANLETVIQKIYPEENVAFMHQPLPEEVIQIQKIRNNQLPRTSSTTAGYIQAIDYKSLLDIAQQHNVLLRIEFRPGEYVGKGDTLVTLMDGKTLFSGALHHEIASAFVIKSRRNYSQDVEFGIEQLVEVAVRALSPGINAPFTAIECIDRLDSALSLLIRNCDPRPYLCDDTGKVCLVMNVVNFPHVVDLAFNQIRQFSTTIPSVSIHLLKAIGSISEHIHTEVDKLALLKHAQMIARGSQRDLKEEEDLNTVLWHYHQVLPLLQPNG
jgi:uncharacterized membrane protein